VIFENLVECDLRAVEPAAKAPEVQTNRRESAKKGSIRKQLLGKALWPERRSRHLLKEKSSDFLSADAANG
jgi:hypothetical protein